ncbi:MAG: hypothetical protein WAM65_01475, partial [Candidatus Korobacteraceae bacterium]
MPRRAATDLARRKTASGISSVVFTPMMLRHLWETVKNQIPLARSGFRQSAPARWRSLTPPKRLNLPLPPR